MVVMVVCVLMQKIVSCCKTVFINVICCQYRFSLTFNSSYSLMSVS